MQTFRREYILAGSWRRYDILLSIIPTAAPQVMMGDISINPLTAENVVKIVFSTPDLPNIMCVAEPSLPCMFSDALH